MGFDFSQLGQMGGQLDQVLSTLPYPIDKDQLIERAEGAGANSQIIGAMQQVLPDKTFNSPQDVKNCFGRGQTRM